MPAHLSTELLRVDRNQPDPAAIARAAAIIQQGGLVAFPTETVYGLGANALDAQAVAGIFAAKERPANDPVIVHIGAIEQLEAVATDIPELAWELARQFWPGPLTLVLKRGAAIPLNVTAQQESVAVRMPAHPVALALLAAADRPIGAPSANRFSRPSPTTAEHVYADLAGRIAMILDGGPCDIGVESSILDLTQATPTVLRPGGIPLETLRPALPALAFRPQYLAEDVIAAPAPGNLLKHYAPDAQMLVFEGEPQATKRALIAAMREQAEAGRRVGVMALDEDAADFAGIPAQIVLLGKGEQAMAASLFAALRELDAAGVDVIMVRTPSQDGLGLAIRDRLLRAAEGQIIRISES